MVTTPDHGPAEDARFREFADLAPAMLWVTDASGSCTYLSRGWYEYTGQSEKEGLGFGWVDAVHPADRDQARDAFVQANAEHRSFELEHRLRRADGAYRWVIDAGRPRLRANGSFEGFVGSVIDIHDRKLAEDRLDLAVNSAGVGLWYCDLPFDVLVWNSHVKRHFGLPADAVVTIETFFARLHPDDRQPTRVAIDQAIARHTAYDTQYRTVDEAGTIRWIRAIGRAQYVDGRPVRFDGVTVDITELVALQQRSEAANHAKDEFLAMLGHELRNPLAPILTAVQLLKLRGVTAVEREREIIERQVAHLVRLVDDLLDVSRITTGHVQLRRDVLDVRDVVAKAIELASPLLAQQRHQLDVAVDGGIRVRGDASRLAQVVTNLLTNAAKYTEPGGRVTIDARADDGQAVLRVTDTGIGIDATMLPRIFDLFVQERQGLARSQGGLGLGLAIVRRLVELHGGSVMADSPGRGQGAVFTVRLPLVSAAERVFISTSSSATPALVTGRRVLIVDDNEDAAVMLGEALRAVGYQTTVVHDGPAALATVTSVRPDAALIDLGLPVMDGFELATHLRAGPHAANIPLIAITGYGQARDREASTRVGYAAHLVKPVDVVELGRLLRSLLGP